MSAAEISLLVPPVIASAAAFFSARAVQRWDERRRSAALVRQVLRSRMSRTAPSVADLARAVLPSLVPILVGSAALQRLELPVAGAVVALSAYLTWRWVRGRRRRRSDLLRAQLPAAVHQVASSLTVGSTIYQALQRAARETPEPLADELRRVVDRMAVNMSLQEAFVLLRHEIPESSAPILAALEIQRTVGGDLAGLLSELSRGLLAQEQLRSEIRVLTAQARYSALIVGALPWVTLGIFAILFFEYVRPLVSEPLGRVMLLVAGGFALSGYIVARRIAAAAQALAQ